MRILRVALSHPQMTPRPVQHGVGSNWAPCSSQLEPTSVLHVGADCRGRLFTAGLAVVVHYPTRQVFDQLLADQATLLACHLLRLSSR